MPNSCRSIIKRLRHNGAITQAEFDKLMRKLDGWIPVTEMLPKEENKKYWICTDNGYQCECRWTNINEFWQHLTIDWHWHIADVPLYGKVVAWMPLPKPYVPDKNVGEMKESEE